MTKTTVPREQPGSKQSAETPCARCGELVIEAARSTGSGVVLVERAKKPNAGNIALQRSLLDRRALVASLSGTGTPFKLHACRGAFTRPPGEGKERPTSTSTRGVR